ncbi:acyl-CoA hydrolase [Litorivivens lipolytica]|uniref:Acyl-CoA hydrolase n=1 Tax=Litorivivens lipolytica TaxID=1524264 RepID=A0A7W4W5Z8_9GAMM|nr:acetyl-CoA hydrolase/transferase C-terminal domain-containing protein [Litorivivens lipolytica]MBB3048096.1 acyl-CoA hydrolase [Litorivivens lipolytica]
MSPHRVHWHTDADRVVDSLIEKLGKNLVVALPLGLGKPVPMVNALYARAKQDRSLKLTLLTALSLARPPVSDDLRGRFLKPVLDRVYDGVPDLDYVADLDSGSLSSNITIKEFFFQPGSRLGNFNAQYHYISSNYTHAARDVFDNGCNVVLQMVASRDDRGSTRLSMSCNPDTSLELRQRLRDSGRPFVSVGVVNEELPYMCGDAEVSTAFYDLLLRGEPHNHRLFSVPKLQPVGGVDALIGLHASALVPDGGTLQIGIGSMGDAVAHGLCLRQKDNARYKDALIRSGVLTPDKRDMLKTIGGTAPFKTGLYGATEMLVEGFLHLWDAGVLKREVYDFWALQQLINEGRCNPQKLDEDVLLGMAELGVREIRGKDFAILQYHGLFNNHCSYRDGYITAPDSTSVAANVANPHSRRVLASQCLGERLINGRLLHGGFFLGSAGFYERLRQLPDDLRKKIDMTSVEKINQLDFNPRLYRAQRINARFINTGLKVTLNGAVVSDTLQNGQVLSGVGGQFNFVSMAHQLLTGRSVIMIRSVREGNGHAESNIVWEYGSCTVPRHLRDLVVTEYGIADLRGKSDGEVIKALLNIADSRFQPNLLARAVADGKVEPEYAIPPQYRDNTPARIAQVIGELRKTDSLPAYPFGTDFSDEELLVAKTLKELQASGSGALLDILKPLGKLPPQVHHWLEVLGLSGTGSIKDRLLERVLAQALKRAFKQAA